MFNNEHDYFGEKHVESTTYQRDLPKILEQVRDDVVNKLTILLVEMLDSADDVLFDLADKAGSNVEQSLYFNSMRELRIKRKGLEHIFVQELKNNFHKLQHIEKAASAHNLQELNISKLTLVHEDELEENLAFDSMVGKANLHFCADLRQIVTRLDTLVANTRVDKLNNPVNPDAICESFRTASNSLVLEIKAKLVIYKIFDRLVVSQLDKLYESINLFLIEQGILPDLSGYDAEIKRSSPQTTTNANPMTRPAITTQPATDSGADVLATLKSFLGTQQPVVATTGTVPDAPIMKTQTSNESMVQLVDNLELVNALSTIQEGSEQRPANDNGYFPASDLRVRLGTMLPVSGPVSSHNIGPVNDDIIDVISLLFDFILDDKNLPDEFKILLGRLQIPILKVAVIDDTFFSKGSHPARKLLNEMAYAGVGWSRDTEGSQFSLRGKVEQIVTHIINEFDDDVALFTDALDEFHEFMETHRNRTSLLEKRLHEAEEGKARAETAKEYAKKALTQIVGNTQLPEVVQRIIFEAWQSIMSLIYLREGDNSGAWKSNLALVEQLMTSLTVTHNPRLRKSLGNRNSILTNSIKKSLDSFGYSEFESQDLCLDLEKLHNRVINGEQVLTHLSQEETVTEADHSDVHEEFTISGIEEITEELVPSDKMDAPPADAVPIDVSDKDNRVISDDSSNISDQDKGRFFTSSLADNGSSHEDDEIMLMVEKLQTGSWFELDIDGKTMRVKLAAIISSVDKYLFVNNTGKKVAEYRKLELILVFRRNKIVQLDDGALFDRALKSIVSNFRTQKQYQEDGL